MKTLIQSALIFALIFSILQISSTVRSISHLRSFPQLFSYVATGSRVFDKGEYFLYAHCEIMEQTVGQFHKKEEKCRIYSEHYDPDDIYSISTESCEIYLKARRGDTYILNDIVIDWLSYPKLIVVWLELTEKPAEETIIHYKIMNIQNCEGIKKTEIKTKEYKGFAMSTLPAIDDSYFFEVAFKNKSLCDGKVCRLKIGRDDGNPIPWFEPFSEDAYMLLYPFKTHDREQKIIVILEMLLQGEEFRISLIDEDGKRVSRDLKSNATIEIDISTNEDKVGVCLRESSIRTRLYCRLYDSNFVPQFETNLDFGYIPMSGSMINLKDGGFLLATGNCKELYCDNSTDSYEVKRIDSKGKISKTFKFNDLNCHKVKFTTRTAVKFHQNKKGNYCLSMMCISRSKLGFTYKCFDEYDLQFPSIMSRTNMLIFQKRR